VNPWRNRDKGDQREKRVWWEDAGSPSRPGNRRGGEPNPKAAKRRASMTEARGGVNVWGKRHVDWKV